MGCAHISAKQPPFDRMGICHGEEAASAPLGTARA
jgi:hypothetical protein